MKQEVDTLLNLAYIYMSYGKTKRAIDYLLIAYRVDPYNLQIKKMQIAAFRDIGAYSQALDIIDDLETQQSLDKNDRITLKLMKSFCLKGLDKLEEGKKVFAEYLKERKEVATKEFMTKYRNQLLKLPNLKTDTETSNNSGDIDTNQDIYQFVRQSESLINISK
jgi:tetratricopeptide (TPR) repeat protein